jgi:hypothetical protein
MIIVCHEKEIRTYDADPQTPGIQWVYEIEGTVGVLGIRSAALRRCTFVAPSIGSTVVVYAESLGDAMLGALAASLFGVLPYPSLARELLDRVEAEERAALALLGPPN